MQYIYYAVTPPKTLASKPLVTNCALTYGVCTDILFVFPKGCYGLVGLQIYDHSELIFPANQNNWLTGDGLAQSFVEGIDLTSGNPQLDVVSYNIDDLYTHSIEIVFTIQPPMVQQSTVVGGVAEGGGGGDITPLPLVCPDGYHEENGVCVKDVVPPVTCPTGYHLENGVCVKDVVPPPPYNGKFEAWMMFI